MACVICKGERQGDNTVEVIRGLPNLVRCSLLREDGLAEVFKKVKSIVVHEECRRRYTRVKVNKFGVLVPRELQPKQPETGVKFVFTAVPESETFVSNNDANVVTETINYNDSIKIEHTTGALSESIESVFSDIAEHDVKSEINLAYDVSTTELKYNFPIEDSASDGLENEPNSMSMTEHEDPPIEPDYDPTKPFPFQHLCFICAKDIGNKYIKNNNKKPLNKRDPVHRVCRGAVKMRVLQRCIELSSPKHDVIKQRIQDVDLVEMNAGYHRYCLGRFFKPEPSVNVRGRKNCVKISTAMEIILRYIEEDNHTTYTTSELLNLLNESDRITVRTLKDRLEKRFGDKIHFTSSIGVPTVITIVRDFSMNARGSINSGDKKTKMIQQKSKAKNPNKKRPIKIKNRNNSEMWDDSYLAPLSPGIAAPSHSDTHCHVCWSGNRRLGGLADCADVYRRICGDFYMVDSEQILLCWECRALLKHALCFQQRVIMSQKILNNEIQFKCLSNMTVATPASSLFSCKPENLNVEFESEDYFKNESTESHVVTNEPDSESFEPHFNDSEPHFSDTETSEGFESHSVIIEPHFMDPVAKATKKEAGDCEMSDSRPSPNRAFDDDDEFPARPKRPRRATNTKRIKKAAVKNNHSDDENDEKNKVDASSSSSDNSDPDWTRPKNKPLNKKAPTVVHRYCGVRTLDFDANTKIEQVAIQPHEVAVWREKERNSTYFNSLAQKCDTCITAVDGDHDRLYHSKDNNYVCVVCSMSCPSKAQLDSHLAGHYSLFRCSICQYQCYDRRHATTHVEMHRRVYQCVECGHEFRSMDWLKLHYNDLHRVAICDYCGKNFGHKLHLEGHIQRNHTVLICTICNIKYKSWARLKAHMDLKHLVSRTENAYCVQCDIQFDNEKLLKRHVYHSVKHKLESKRPTAKSKPKPKEKHQCPACPNVYSSVLTLRGHYDFQHAGKIKFRCNICDQPFPLKNNLKNHMKRHEGFKLPKNKFCDTCGQGFQTNKSLTNHIRTHTGERPYVCEHCGARFAQRGAMRTHVRHIHEGKKRSVNTNPTFRVADRRRPVTPPC